MNDKIIEKMPDGTTIELVSVPIKESSERWSDVTLDDGTKVKLKLNIISVQRALNKYDNNGVPMYRIKTAPFIFVDFVPDELKSKKD